MFSSGARRYLTFKVPRTLRAKGNKCCAAPTQLPWISRRFKTFSMYYTSWVNMCISPHL